MPAPVRYTLSGYAKKTKSYHDSGDWTLEASMIVLHLIAAGHGYILTLYDGNGEQVEKIVL